MVNGYEVRLVLFDSYSKLHTNSHFLHFSAEAQLLFLKPRTKVSTEILKLILCSQRLSSWKQTVIYCSWCSSDFLIKALICFFTVLIYSSWVSPPHLERHLASVHLPFKVQVVVPEVWQMGHFPVQLVYHVIRNYFIVRECVKDFRSSWTAFQNVASCGPVIWTKCHNPEYVWPRLIQ